MERPREKASCGVQGCLLGAVLLFVVLLVGLLIISVFRFSQPPQGMPAPPAVGYGQCEVPSPNCGGDSFALRTPHLALHA